MASADLTVLLDGTPLLGDRTGIGRYTGSLIRELSSMSTVDIRVFGVTTRGWRRLRSILPEGARAVGPPLPARALRASWSRIPLPPVEVLAGVTDVVHGTNFVLPPSLQARGVVTVHDLAFLDAPDELAERELPRLVRLSAQRATVVCTPTEAVADAVTSRLGVPRSKIAVTALGVDREWFGSVPPDPDLRRKHGLPAEYLLFVGADGPRKGLPGLLQAHGRDLPPLVIAGPGGTSSAERVVRTGYLPDDELRSVVAGASALVLPSRDEGFGLPALEALACGVPVVCSDIPALREVASGHAVYFPFGDTEALRAALHEALAQRDNGEAVAARRSHAAGFTWRACAEATLAAYQRAARS
jgi:glycosyltransferase involved in cell wall biosynthesis